MTPSMSEPEIHDKETTIADESQNGQMQGEESAAPPVEVSAPVSEPTKKKKKKKKESSGSVDPSSDNRTTNKGDDNARNISEGPREPSGKEKPEKEKSEAKSDLSVGPVVSATKRTRPAYKFDPDKITLRFLFANRDGLTVTMECSPMDTVATVKAQLLSVWPADLQSCTSGDQLRLICMGKGILMPDSRTLHDCEVPVFKTHPTPVNVAVRPKESLVEYSKSVKDGASRGGGSSGASGSRTMEQSGQGCGCIIS